eukprot:CAMPEP_0168750260 /NCGR_PEP_ID=MMETSP0724-20121128/17173_1 /TAXON_ID=265536 /ORGANISM="Amphiprora sp., Strain CCMP467" /LENGTH=730 /DNA_ID=CAMNT_0008798261 /DNA_START=26 /DNA_END=2218 /DNA_ORIENTATION=+
MVSAENRTGLYVSIPVYFVVLGLSALWAYKRLEKMTTAGTDHLSGHYLGGRAFGPLLTAGTVFASLFSGYTVVGIPNEAYRSGFYSFRWMPATAMILLGYICTGLRLRKASMVRNHQTSADFITDRFQSQFLRYSIVLIQVVGTLIYLSAQVNALKSTFNSMFGVEADTNWTVILLMTIILMLEWMGGLSSVALTDSIQGFVMMLSFVLLPIIIKNHFGGWTELDPSTYPRPDFYQTPTRDEQWRQWQFYLLGFSFFTLPHLMQRVYAARDLKSLRFGWAVLTVSPWVAMFIGVFLGTVGVQILSDAGVEDPANPFTAIIEEVMNVGGFAKGVGVISLTASLAAIMSTADSLIIAASQLITVEIVYPLRPNASPMLVAWRGRGVSLLTTAFALIIGITWKDGVGDLAAINFAITIMAVPSFVVGLYMSGKWDVHPWVLAIASLVSMTYVFIVYFMYIKTHSDAKPIDAGVTGLALNLFLIVVLETGYRFLLQKPQDNTNPKEHKINSEQKRRELNAPDRPAWDVPKLERFGETTLSPRLLNKMMAGTNEPFRNVWYTLFFFFAVSIVTPLVAENEPWLDAETGEFAGGVLPATYNGLPWWFFKQILLSIVPYIILIVTVWRVPSQFPSDEREIQKNGVDLDIVEMTPSEMNRRSSYDESNALFQRRRSSIHSQMVAMGLTVPEGDSSEDSSLLVNDPGEKELRLSALVLGKTPIDESIATDTPVVEESAP